MLGHRQFVQTIDRHFSDNGATCGKTFTEMEVTHHDFITPGSNDFDGENIHSTVYRIQMLLLLCHR